MFTAAKYLLVRWIRSLGLENVTLHILLEVLTPFLVYLLAEAIGCSGVFAVFTTGVSHSFAKKRLNPDNVKLNNASESVWDMLSFSLNGLVFLLMGIQLPGIIKTIVIESFPISPWRIAAYILGITAFFIVTRFVWSLTIRNRTYTEENASIGKIKAGIIISLSGARGAVTLASILSIPLLLDDGTRFPERDLLILISTSIILISLILADYVLPLMLGKDKSINTFEKENDAYIEILQGVVSALQTQTSEVNKAAVGRVMRDYYRRINDLKNQKHISAAEREEERTLKMKALTWEMENTQSMLDAGTITKYTAEHYLEIINVILRTDSKRTGFPGIFLRLRYFLRFLVHSKDEHEHLKDFLMLWHNNTGHVLEKLRQLLGAEDNAAVRKMISEYEMSVSILETRHGGGVRGSHGENSASEESMKEVLAQGFQLERNGIQAMLEQGRISREYAKEMRNNIAALELKLEET